MDTSAEPEETAAAPKVTTDAPRPRRCNNGRADDDARGDVKQKVYARFSAAGDADGAVEIYLDLPTLTTATSAAPGTAAATDDTSAAPVLTTAAPADTPATPDVVATPADATAAPDGTATRPPSQRLRHMRLRPA